MIAEKNNDTTENKAIRGFLKDVDDVLFKIHANTAYTDDYKHFQELMELVGISKAYLDETLKKNGFKDWEEFDTQRKKGDLGTLVKISSVIGAIYGLSNAVIEHFTKHLDKK